jgi:hypothetical protein
MCGLRTIYKWGEIGAMKGIEVVGRRLRYSIATVQDVIEI